MNQTGRQEHAAMDVTASRCDDIFDSQLDAAELFASAVDDIFYAPLDVDLL